MTSEPGDAAWMAQALLLAERGLWTTTPNPRVGCILVHGGRVVAEGWHERAGEPHAEAMALAVAGHGARGATAYVTLEPCSHFGRTPPCADALVHAGVARVVVATMDPNPLVSGAGIARLRDAGVQVDLGVLEEAARELNLGFESRMRRGRPWLRSKIAMSLDGVTALADGTSQWITGDLARADGHRWRARSCAMLTGAGTVLHDDPQLNVRAVDTTRQPLRIVVDNRLETPLNARILSGGGTLVATVSSDEARADALRGAGADVVRLPPGRRGRVDLAALMTLLGERQLNEVTVEAGARLNGALVDAGMLDEFLFYVAPMLLGAGARGALALGPLAALAEGVALDVVERTVLGRDERVLARVRHPGSPPVQAFATSPPP